MAGALLFAGRIGLFRGFYVRQHLFCVALGFNFAEGVHDLSFRRNQVRRSFHAFHFFAVHVLLFEDAERVSDLFIGISE
jgi:hypothetical protein